MLPARLHHKKKDPARIFSAAHISSIIFSAVDILLLITHVVDRQSSVDIGLESLQVETRSS